MAYIAINEKYNLFNVTDKFLIYELELINQKLKAYFQNKSSIESIKEFTKSVIRNYWLEFIEKIVNFLPNIVFNRLDDIYTANQAMNDLVELIALEEIAISDPENCKITQQVLQNTMAFKSECDRLFIIIRDRIGFIGQNNSVIEQH
tara:strand:+ start:1693 stop:2133 length:441 start_codon:yes stop_codon:yes gene_type:complete